MTATARWISIVIAFLVANALAMGFLVMASRTSRAQVIPDYYDKAAHYDSQIDQAAKNRALGWQVEVHAGLAIEVRDARGPIEGAQVRVIATSRAHGRVAELALAPSGVGRYAVAHRASGLEDLAIVVERGGERFTAHATIE